MSMLSSRLTLCAALPALLLLGPLLPASADDEEPAAPAAPDAVALRAEITASRQKAADAHVAAAREKLLGAARAVAKDAGETVQKSVDAFVAEELGAVRTAWLERERARLEEVSAETLARIKEREKDGSFGVAPEARAFTRPWIEGLPERHLPGLGLLELRTGLGRWVIGVDSKSGELFGLDAEEDFARVGPHLAPALDQQAVAEVYRLLWSILGPPFDGPPPAAKIVLLKATGGYAVNAELVRSGFSGGKRTREIWVMATTKDGKVTGFQRRSEEAKAPEKPAPGSKPPTRSGKPRSVPHAPEKKDGG